MLDLKVLTYHIEVGKSVDVLFALNAHLKRSQHLGLLVLEARAPRFLLAARSKQMITTSLHNSRVILCPNG